MSRGNAQGLFVLACEPGSAFEITAPPFAGGPVEYRHSSSAATRVDDVERKQLVTARPRGRFAPPDPVVTDLGGVRLTASRSSLPRSLDTDVGGADLARASSGDPASPSLSGCELHRGDRWDRRRAARVG
jgi:hypothetical protein